MLDSHYLGSFGENEKAKGFFLAGYDFQSRGLLRGAMQNYERSIAHFPTAEAYTFLAWAYAQNGKYDRAIDHCLKAIETDPTLGNPYNDLGIYLIEKQNYYRAMHWLAQAKTAERYDTKHFPYYNMGRALEAVGHIELARLEYQDALKIESQYLDARLALDKILVRYN